MENRVFGSALYSLGTVTNRDAWCINFSKEHSESNIRRLIRFYSSELQRIKDTNFKGDVTNFVRTDLAEVSWTLLLKRDLQARKELDFKDGTLIPTLYRPFTKSWRFYSRRLNERLYQMPKIFTETGSENLVIAVTGLGVTKGFTTLISDTLPDLQVLANGQCFPLYLYEKTDSATDTELFSQSGSGEDGHTRRNAITDAGLEHFRKAYGDAGKGITKEDLFYYIYGLLHSPEYRSRYADNLSKELPRIPAVKKFADFMAFSKAGRELADWHLNYETSAMHEDIVVDTGKERGHSCPPASKTGTGMSPPLTAADYRVEKMKFAKVKDPETNKSVPDKTTVIYNPRITLRHIPLEAYEYVVNGKPALEWVMERQSVTTDKASGITNDANLWATETMNNPAYPMELFLRVAKVSVETVRIVKELPKLEIIVTSLS